MENLYKVLGVHQDVSVQEIKKAYHVLARFYHPDTTPLHDKEFAKRKFEEITAAYKVLSDPIERSQYDEELSRASAPPCPAVWPKSLEFGSVRHGARQFKSFHVHNLGGPASELNFDFSENDGRYTINKNEIRSHSESEFFPVEVPVMVCTEPLQVDQRYHGWVEINLDGNTARVRLRLFVKARALLPELWPTDVPDYTPFPDIDDTGDIGDTSYGGSADDYSDTSFWIKTVIFAVLIMLACYFVCFQVNWLRLIKDPLGAFLSSLADWIY